MFETIIDFIIRNWFFLLIIAGLLVALWFENRRRVSRFASKEEFTTLIQGGTPVVVEFFDDT
jgi:hypothetical protein